MVCLFGIAGLAGAGKTTAAQYLSEATRGQYIYIGDAVLAEVQTRGLAETRENERLVSVLVRHDRTELETLGIGAVICGASESIRNEGSFEEFYRKLADFLNSCSSNPA